MKRLQFLLITMLFGILTGYGQSQQWTTPLFSYLRNAIRGTGNAFALKPYQEICLVKRMRALFSDFDDLIIVEVANSA